MPLWEYVVRSEIFVILIPGVLSLMLLSALGLQQETEALALPPILAVENLEAYRDGDTLHITGMVVNRGVGDIDAVYIDLIHAGNLVIDQKIKKSFTGEYQPVLRLQNTGSDTGQIKHYCETACVDMYDVYAEHFPSSAVDAHSGFSLSNGDLTSSSGSALAGGHEARFVLSISNGIHDDPSVDISDNILLVDDLSLTLRGQSYETNEPVQRRASLAPDYEGELSLVHSVTSVQAGTTVRPW